MNKETAVIFGATSAVAQAVCRKLLDSGICNSFCLIGRDATRLEAVSDDLTVRGATSEAIVSDLADIHGHEDLVAHVKKGSSFWFFYGSLPDQARVENDWDETRAALYTNFMSCASLLTRIAQILEERPSAGSSIVVVSSVAGDRGRQSNYVYGTAKGALSLFCQGLRNRLHKSGVHVLTVKPGFIDTPMTADIAKTPPFLWASPEKIASVMVTAFERKKDVIYAPWFWRYLLMVIKSIPESIFKKLSL